MTFFLGVFKIDRFSYCRYSIYFNDVSGLEKKADVKIAGVKVGWLESIELVSKDPYQAKATIMVHKKYHLRINASAVVRQDGLLGTKYLEITPGDPRLPTLSHGQTLKAPGVPPASIDSILHDVSEISGSVKTVTESFEETLGGQEGKEQVKILFDNVQKAADRFAGFAGVLDRTLSGNEETINTMITDFKEVARSMKETLPSIKEGIERMSNRIDQDMGSFSTKLESSAEALEHAARQAQQGFKNLHSITEKLDEGKGILGKLINEDETYRSLKITMDGVKNYFSKVDELSIVFDSHGEYMYRPAEHVNFEDAKGYLEARINSNDDHFYVLQYVMAQKGSIVRTIREVRWFDENAREIIPSEFIDSNPFGNHEKAILLPELIGRIETRERTLDQAKIGVQFGKTYKNISFRAGLFEGSAGLGVDFDIPFQTERFRWITSVEVFDFRGRDRFDDKRPHFKWINRLFLLDNIYIAFGADDIVSKENSNGFFGAGLRFCDDDIKYLLSQVGFSGFN